MYLHHGLGWFLIEELNAFDVLIEKSFLLKLTLVVQKNGNEKNYPFNLTYLNLLFHLFCKQSQGSKLSNGRREGWPPQPVQCQIRWGRSIDLLDQETEP